MPKSHIMGQEKRRFPRTKHRLGCEFEVLGVRYSGIVTDVSARGLFVQSSAIPKSGTELELLLRSPDHGEIVLQARAIRLTQRHRAAAAMDPKGFGLEITRAPEQYFAMLVALSSH